MNILIINSCTLPLPPVNGGAVENLIDIYLRENENTKNPNNITVYSIYNENALKYAENYKNVKFNYIKNNSIIDKISKCFRYATKKITQKYVANVYLNKIYKDLKSKISSYDLVIIENVAEYGLIIKKLKPKRMVLHLHNDILNIETNQANEIYNSYDEFWCLSEFIMNRVKEIKATDKVKLLYNGIDVKKFDIQYNNKKVNELKSKFNILKDDFVLMYSGRLVPEKGVLELLKAFDKIQANNIKLLVVGSSIYGHTQKTKYINELQKISIRKKENVIYTGYIDYSDIPYIYQLANVGIVPSKWEEPFALTVVEFLASGKPIIATNSGAIPELINENVAVIVDKKENMIENLYRAIIEFIETKKEYNSIEIKKYVRQFDSSIYYNRFEKLVRRKHE